MSDGFKKEELDALGQPPPTDRPGDIDLNLLELSLRLAPAERVARHHAALELVRALDRVAARQNANSVRHAVRAEKLTRS